MPVRSRTRMLALAVATSSFLAVASPAHAATLVDNFERHASPTTWRERTVYGQWRLAYNGYGIVGIRTVESKLLALRPATARSSGETHAALVTSQATFGDQIIRLRMRTARQLRTGTAPRPWERAWVLWHVLDGSRFYYVILKSNGWEIGKADPTAGVEGQRYLASATLPAFQPGQWNDVSIRHAGGRIDVWANGSFVGGADDPAPYGPGKVGLYTEDAEAHFDDVRSWSI